MARYWALLLYGCICLAVCSGCTPRPQVLDTLVPLSRLLNESFSVDHCTTTSTVEKNEAVAIHGYVDEGILGWVYEVPQLGTVPLVRYYVRGETYHDHYLCADFGSLCSPPMTYEFEKVIGYAYLMPLPGTTPLYRLYKGAPWFDHFCTTDESERQMAIHELGYMDDGIVAYVWPIGFVPPHRYGRPWNIEGEVIFIGNEYLTVGVDLLRGGSITYLTHNQSDSTRNLVDKYDTGRYIQIAVYDDPALNYTYNPVQGGDAWRNPSGWINHWTTASEVYVQCRPLHWNYMNQGLMKQSDVVFETWVSVPGQYYVRVKHRITYEGTSPLSASDRQEMPAVYTIASLSRQLVYNGDAPWCGEPYSEYSMDNHETAFNPTERWSALADCDNIGVVVFNPRSPGSAVQNNVRTVFTNHSDNAHPTSFMSFLRTFGFSGGGQSVEFEYYLIPGDVGWVRQLIYTNFKPSNATCQQ